jgi:hypothetical protein
MQAGEFRGMADVALNADPATPYLTAYEAGWWYFGGTSVGAPIWAALVALANQRRVEQGRPTLGLAAPALCEIAHAYDGAEPFRDVTEGHNLMYSAGRGWDHPTGWGTPRADELVRALAEWSPPVSSVRGVSEGVVLRAAAEVRGRARLLMRRRCASTQIKLRLYGVAPGDYTLQLDGRPVAGITASARGSALVRVSNADARGCRITINDADGEVLFSGSFEEAQEDRSQIEAAMTSTGAAARASATLYYRSGAGREQLTILGRGLPAGTYDVVVAGTVIGALRAYGEEHSIWARFDSDGRGRSHLPLSPRCKSVSLVAGGVAFLRSQASALGCQVSGS